MSAIIPSQYFMPNFPIKSSKSRSPTKKQPVINSIFRLNKKICEDLNLINCQRESKGNVIGYKNQNNYCEIRSLILTPVRLTNLEISLPEISALSSPKFPSRRIGTAQTRRRSIESKSILNVSVEYPAEIITTKYSVRLNSAKVGQYGRRKNSEQMRKSQGLSLMRNKTGDERNRINYERNRDNETGSVTNYSPMYTNTFDT